MHPALSRVAHRPWPLPATPWLWRQTWHALLFAHWPVAVDVVRPFVPSWLRIQEFDGSTWVGLVPFTMTGVTLRGVPSLPILSHFHEMNLRVYVERDDRPGVWFISLDAARRPAVWAARTLAHLPYFHSRMRVDVSSNDEVSYSATRREKPRVQLIARYAPAGSAFESRPGTLEHFLTERYCLYTQDRRGRPRRLEIHHHPWPLQKAEADFAHNDVAAAQGLPLPDARPVLHFSDRLDVIGWGLELVPRRA